jgi:polysaccharide biosynthesis protein PslA
MKPSLQADLDDFGRTEPFAQHLRREGSAPAHGTLRNSVVGRSRRVLVPQRRFDPGAVAAGERLALIALYSMCGCLAVVSVNSIAQMLAYEPWPSWQLWAVFFPVGLALPAASRRFQLIGSTMTEALTLIGLVMRAVTVIVVLQALVWVAGFGMTSVGILFCVLLVHLLFCCYARWSFRKITSRWRRKLRVVIVGVGQKGVAVGRHLQAHSDDIEVLGFVDERRTRIDAANLTAPFLGTIEDLCENDHGADVVMLAIPNTAAMRIQTLTMLIRCRGIDVYLAPEEDLLNFATTRHYYDALDSSLLLNLNSLPLEGRISKRLFDIVFSALALIAFVPFGLIIAALIRLESPGPVIFKQPRFGRGNYLFDLYKFRSMRFDAKRNNGEIRLTERGDSRVTRIGAFLRRTSLDEFPQFFNVLRGDMSVVGPRPHPPGVKAGERIYEEVVPGFMERYTLRPGITGWAQVNGLRGNTFTENDLIDRFARDVQYIRNWSLELDLWIVLKTIRDGFGAKNAF